MMKPNYKIGDMFMVRLVYSDNPDQSKMRPIVIIDMDDDDFLYVKFTSRGPKNNYSPHEKLKQSFPNWRKNNLDRASWFVNKTFILSRLDFEKLEKECLGEMKESDYYYILKQLENT